MGKQTRMEVRFREEVRRERERQGWSQLELAKRMQDTGAGYVLASTVGKIECGDRTVRVDEAAALADIFNTTVDALLGRPSDGADLLWAISKLSSNAHKMVNEITSLQHRLRADAQDVRDYAERSSKREEVESTFGAVRYLDDALRLAHKRASGLASEFPLPGRG